jgi:hypothetical protein
MKRLRFLILILICLFLLKSDVVPQTQSKIEQDILVRIDNTQFVNSSLIFTFESTEDPYYPSYIFNTFNKYFEYNNMDIEKFLTITGIDNFTIIYYNKTVIYERKKIIAYFALKKAEQKKFLQQKI